MFVRCLVIVDANQGEMTIGRHGEQIVRSQPPGDEVMTETQSIPLTKSRFSLLRKSRRCDRVPQTTERRLGNRQDAETVASCNDEQCCLWDKRLQMM
jgi:hypothetical protein